MLHINTVPLFGCIFLCVVTSATERRILLNDPSYVAQELNHLQSELQDLRVQVNSQQQTIASLQSNMSTQKYTMDVQGQTIINLQHTVTSQQSAIVTITQRGSGKGTVFTRWGKNDCPVGNGTHLVYSGFVGGEYYNHSGGAANFLCMPEVPTPGQSHYNTYPGFIYGAEIQRGYDLFGLPQNDEDVSCAVCRNSVHATSVMIPGRTTCFPGWVEAYSGFIVAGYPDHPSNTDYICMDGHPQPVPGGQGDDDGVLLRPVVTKCGSLPCPPYENDKLVPCVVCMM
ncbi:hypothetical protein KP79_PYT26185 [Mizuhopecten yessoensis]|uniref:Short-chain collagen C4 n=1 Tax=Mizuhopecten yessoensis TaxID=6573 RepID=A0A210QF51_MIZYE|nr:hypothetical protein KP79_PYT26185 [Mizuhopecten yessoensis]